MEIGHVLLGDFKGPHSIPSIEIEEVLYLLEEDIINRLFVLVRESYFIKFNMGMFRKC